MIIISLLNLPIELPAGSPARVNGDETFITNLPEWIARCMYKIIYADILDLLNLGQTYEGGIGGAPTNEAHGAYAFCGLACLCLLGPPAEMIPRYAR